MHLMPHAVAVVAVSDSFGEVWPRLIAALGAECVTLDSAGGLGGVPAPAAAVVCGAGRETAALDAVRGVRSAGVPVCLVGTEGSHVLARQARAAGGDDYFVFPAEVGELRAWLQGQLSRATLRGLGEARELARPAAFGRLLGESRGLRQVLRSAELLSDSGSSTILITGETGTGKDMLAQAVHERSPRAAARFVEINCAALPTHLLEAELFGYEKGAFTDARSAKPGLVEAAEGGTLFLDEIGDLPLELQGKLLRLLETRRSRRLGALREVQVDTRVIAATHVELAQRVRDGRFREDLFYRLDVLALTLPPLREREADAVLLAEHFGREFGRTYGVEVPPLSPAVRAAVQAYPWPGNVRQLRNAVERAVILGRGEITLEHLRLHGTNRPVEASLLPFPATLDQIQAAAAQAAVAACAGNKSRAADLLGISRKGLYGLLRAGSAGEVKP